MITKSADISSSRKENVLLPQAQAKMDCTFNIVSQPLRTFIIQDSHAGRMEWEEVS